MTPTRGSSRDAAGPERSLSLTPSRAMASTRRGTPAIWRPAVSRMQVVVIGIKKGARLHGDAQALRTEVHNHFLQQAVGPRDDQLAHLGQVLLQPSLWQRVEPIAQVVLHSRRVALVEVPTRMMAGFQPTISSSQEPPNPPEDVYA